MTGTRWRGKTDCDYILRVIFFLLFLFFSLITNSQRYNFTHLGVESGLVQSQVNSIVQDEYGMLWIGTLGGVSRYDGKNFVNYDKQDGLLNSFVYRIQAGKSNKLWFGTYDGVQSFDGKNYLSYAVTDKPESRFVTDFAEAGNEVYFISAGNKLFKINGTKAEPVFIENPVDTIIAIETDKTGFINAVIFGRGVYRYEGNKWKQVHKFYGGYAYLPVQDIFFSENNDLWLLGSTGVCRIVDGKLIPVKIAPGNQPLCLSIAEDEFKNIWVGTVKGTYLLSPDGNSKYIGSENGLSDNAIYDIFKDREGNLWFASDGNGIYKFTDNSFSFFDRSTGLRGELVMAMIRDKQSGIWIGTAEGGLSKYDGQSFRHYPIPSSKAEAQKINALLSDHEDRLWIGTIGGGLWMYKNAVFTNMSAKYPGLPNDIVTIYEDSRQRIWITSPFGCYYYYNDKFQKVAGVDISCFAICELSKDSILIGTTDGIRLLSGMKDISVFDIPGTRNLIINQIKSWKDYLVIGTDVKGLLFYHLKNKSSSWCSETEGLSANLVFSVLPDSNIIYAGTVNGINKISFDTQNKQFRIQVLKPANMLAGPECNQNAILKTSNGNIWTGTTQGISIYNPAISRSGDYRPSIYLDAVRLFTKEINPDNIVGDSMIAWKRLPVGLTLKPRQNHLTFELKGLYLTNPDILKYQFMLEGADTGYSLPTSIPSIIYSNLSPGKYVFKARTVIDNNHYSSIIEYPFEIKSPFYQTTWFRILAVIFLIGIGAFYQQWRMKIKVKKQANLQKVREQEQQRVQQKTAEDLHDDLGNKITRIALLTDVLQSKLSTDEENKKLIRQVKENVQALYVGTKDIIWALSPDNNSLGDMLARIGAFGNELFEGSGTEFMFKGDTDVFNQQKLPIEYGRNMTLILKEALNNILKHAEAQNAEIEVKSDINHIQPKELFTLEIAVQDNGKGIDLDRVVTGFGLGNIRRRLDRINGSLEIKPGYPNGTLILLKIKIPRNEG